MTSAHLFKSDLPKLHSIVQNNMTVHMKELVISSLRDFFSKDSFYHYVADQWGYPQTPDHTDLPLTAGLNDNTTTRLWIGEAYRQEVVYFPAVIVKAGGINSVPISFNRESGSVQYGDLVFQDGYGNIKVFKTPSSFIFAGAWEGSITISIQARDVRTRDDLLDLISLQFVDIYFNELVKEGLIITGVSTSGPTETDDRNQKLHQETITLKSRSEWRRLVHIDNIVHTINAAIEFGNTNTDIVAPNITININQPLAQILSNL